MRFGQALVSTLVITLTSAVGATAAELTGDIWTITGIDDVGTSWSASTLLFTSQIPDGNDFGLQGYFDWYGSAGQLGREFFVGTLFQDDTLELSGTSVVAIPGVGGPNGVIAGMYFAILDSSGNRMVGDWSGNTGGIPGDFVATRIPEPCTGITCAFAVMCIVTMRCRRGR
jgi:hypothetical protein